MALSIEDINKLESENKELKKQVAQWQHEYELLDACIEIYEQKVKELKQENERLKENS